MRLIDADALKKELMKYITGGEAESPADCAVFNAMVKNAPTVDLQDKVKKAVRNIKEYKVVDGYIHVQIYDVEQAIEKVIKKPRRQ